MQAHGGANISDYVCQVVNGNFDWKWYARLTEQKQPCNQQTLLPKHWYDFGKKDIITDISLQKVVQNWYNITRPVWQKISSVKSRHENLNNTDYRE